MSPYRVAAPREPRRSLGDWRRFATMDELDAVAAVADVGPCTTREEVPDWRASLWMVLASVVFTLAGCASALLR